MERMLAARATSRLRQMIRTSDDIGFQIVECLCQAGTEGYDGVQLQEGVQLLISP
jgi:hypothetical protein